MEMQYGLAVNTRFKPVQSNKSVLPLHFLIFSTASVQYMNKKPNYLSPTRTEIFKFATT